MPTETIVYTVERIPATGGSDNSVFLSVNVKDQDRNPVSGLSLTLDGEVTKDSSDDGRVLFSNVPPGEHTLSNRRVAPTETEHGYKANSKTFTI